MLKIFICIGVINIAIGVLILFFPKGLKKTIVDKDCNLESLNKRVKELELELLRSKDRAKSFENEYKYMEIKNYEEKGYSIEEICEAVSMNEGEVILLKKLYKDRIDY